MPGKKTLLILRHAKAEPAEEHQADHDRPLAPRGLLEAPRVGELLVELELVPELILSSTALRARQTTEAVVNACQFAGRLEYLDELYLASPGPYFDALHRYGDHARCALVVGHNPGLEDFLHVLTGDYPTLRTAGLAIVRLKARTWDELTPGKRQELLRVIRPKEL